MAVAAFALGEVGFQCVANLADLDIGQMLDADEFGPRLLDRAQNLVELGLHRRAVAVLTVLDQEHGQKGEDGRRRVDDQLPGVGKMQQRAAHRPDEDEGHRSEEHTSELQSLMRISYAVFCLNKKNKHKAINYTRKAC